MSTDEVLTREQLNRATLARQLLLERERISPVKAVERLAGLQAQEPKPPFAGLWTRVADFDREQLTKALKGRKLVRGLTMRATLHLLSARDYTALRTSLQPVLTRAMGALRGRDQGLDLDKVLPAARALLEEDARTFTELRGLLAEQFPQVNERALGYSVRTQLPLVMVPTDDPWGFPRDARFTLAETWLGEAPSEDDAVEQLVLRYLAAFGPAAAADVQTWSGLKGIKAVLDGLGDKLLTFKDESGRTLFDLPKAPRPEPDVPAPPRFLPAFDNLVLAHRDRTRVLPDEHRGKVVTKNLRVHPTFLWDGFVAGTWAAERKRGEVTLRLTPFEKLSKRALDELADEGEGLLRFLEPDAETFVVDPVGAAS